MAVEVLKAIYQLTEITAGKNNMKLWTQTFLKISLQELCSIIRTLQSSWVVFAEKTEVKLPGINAA